MWGIHWKADKPCLACSKHWTIISDWRFSSPNSWLLSAFYVQGLRLFWDRLVKDQFELVDCHVFPCIGKELKQWLWVALTSFLKATIPGLELRAKFVKLYHNRSESTYLKLCRADSLSLSHLLWSWNALKAVKYKPQVSGRGCIQELWWLVNAWSRGNTSLPRGHCNMVRYGLWRGWWGMI